MRLFLCLITFVNLLGCGLLKQAKEPAYYSEFRKQNKDILHVYSCGPQALQKTFAHFGIDTNVEELSYIIQKNFKCNNLTRDIAAIFVNDARRITFPQEMLYVFEKYGFKIKKIEKFEDLNEKTDAAIVLVKKNGTIYYHWMSFPKDKNILTFFGIDTVVKEIYLISK